ncbi:hypothetical protein ALC60_06665 [Trachymyrmex zeteki]|uniref:Uncharacterized protein n=1 Tax=Mycetomoellerius zeteki TaxID=64791 RepID=A0A151X2A8_9HYME|nr:hypothetical protein ALC60_06665 [Trachymyrmex zeteki]
MANAFGRQLKSVQPKALSMIVGDEEVARDTLQTVSGSTTLAMKVSRDAHLGRSHRSVILRQFRDYRGAVLPRKGERFLASGGFLFPDRIIQLPGGQLYTGKVGKQIGEQIGDRCGAVAAGAGDGQRAS